MFSELLESIEIASLMDKAKDLKHDSIIWCVLFPYKFSICNVNPAACESDWKNSLNIS